MEQYEIKMFLYFVAVVFCFVEFSGGFNITIHAKPVKVEIKSHGQLFGMSWGTSINDNFEAPDLRRTSANRLDKRGHCDWTENEWSDCDWACKFVFLGFIHGQKHPTVKFGDLFHGPDDNATAVWDDAAPATRVSFDGNITRIRIGMQCFDRDPGKDNAFYIGKSFPHQINLKIMTGFRFPTYPWRQHCTTMNRDFFPESLHFCYKYKAICEDYDCHKNNTCETPRYFDAIGNMHGMFEKSSCFESTMVTKGLVATAQQLCPQIKLTEDLCSKYINKVPRASGLRQFLQRVEYNLNRYDCAAVQLDVGGIIVTAKDVCPNMTAFTLPS